MSKTVGQMAREYARDNMPKDFDPEFFDHENPTRFQNRMDEWYQIQIIFKAGYAAAQAEIKARDVKIIELESEVIKHKKLIDVNMSTLRLIRKQALKHANRCKPHDMDSHTWSETKERKSIYNSFIVGAKCENSWNKNQILALQSKLEKTERDTERLNFMDEYECGLQRLKFGGWKLLTKKFDWVKWNTFHSPRVAIDAAMEATKAKGE